MTYSQLIERCNDFIWHHMFPDGSLEFRSKQHRDLVRTFFAGAFEALMLVKDHKTLDGMIVEYQKMCKVRWLPDERFQQSDK